MVFQPGQSGNPSGYNGPRHVSNRHKIHREVYEQTKALGHKDALLTLSEIQNDTETDTNVRVSAASALAPFFHPKLQSLPVPRFITTPFEVPEFHTIQDASTFLAKIPVLVARGELDIDFGKELSAMASAWIGAKQASEIEERLTIIEQSLDVTPANGRSLAVTGGLPRLPGTSIRMPGDPGPDDNNDGPRTNGAAPPEDDQL